MLRSLGQDESESSLSPEGIVVVTCAFCNQPYQFDRVDLRELFATMPVAPGSSTTQ